MSKTKAYLSAILFSVAVLGFLSNTSKVSAEGKQDTIPKGVFIDEVDISLMTREEAKEAVHSFVDTLKEKGIVIRIGDDMVFATVGSLGYDYEPYNHLKEAAGLGTQGNLIKRYKDLKDIEQGKITYPLTFTIDESKIRELVETKVSAYNVKPVNATVTRKNGSFVYTDHVVGSKVDVDRTVKRIRDSVMEDWNRLDIIVDAQLEDDMPLYTRDIVEKCNTLLGEYTTEYTSSAEGRAANLANGARLINNSVLYPGEVFSGYEYLAPFSVSNGYYEAGAYSQGRVIDSIGGGACQVTTTLYNAALFSELEIVERQEHSMTITYVELSRDAAIAGTYKDLKFKNNTDAPILIEAVTKDRRITFRIWGNETRNTNNRRVEYVTKVLSETKPPADVITKDPTKPITYRKVTQSAHTGYKAELYKVIYENDVEISRELVNKSSYAAAPRYVTIGTKVEEKKETVPKTDGANKNTPNNDAEKQDKLDNTAPVEDTQVESQSAESNYEEFPMDEFYWDPIWDTEEVQE